MNNSYKKYVDNSVTPNRDNLAVASVEDYYCDAFNFIQQDLSLENLVNQSEQINNDYDKHGMTGNAVSIAASTIIAQQQQQHVESPTVSYGKGKKIKMSKRQLSDTGFDSSSSSSADEMVETTTPSPRKTGCKRMKTMYKSPKEINAENYIHKYNSNNDDDDDSDDGENTNDEKEINSDDNGMNVNTKKYVCVKKVRGRYNRAIRPKVDVSKAVELVKDSDTAAFAVINNQVVKSKCDVENLSKIILDERDRKFAGHMTNMSYYMFVVCKPRDPADRFRLFYANCVNSVTLEYAGRYSNVDRLVMVVSYDKFRFMISYQLLKDLNVPIPQSDDFNSSVYTQKAIRECHFNEVKDFEFLTLLTNTFNLDMTYVRVKTTLMFASLGEYKTNLILDTLNSMHVNKNLYTLPFNLENKEVVVPENVMGNDVYPYIDSVVKLSREMRFKKMDLPRPNDDRAAVALVLDHLKFWLRDKNTKSSDFKSKECFFIYKYGSVVRLLYDAQNANVNKLVKIKKENSACSALIEEYLNVSGIDDNSENFILFSTKFDERITIIKFGVNYLWLTSVIKNIIPIDIIHSYKKHNHHIFNMNKLNRKEINNRHNGMIKLLAFYTGQFLTMDQVIDIAQNNFACTYTNKNYVNNN
ncbi:immediate early 1 [Orgyia leucostigma nucleopolyhedrovirus]|uniref:Immediate early 1 n=1 Tax=Orgyia leucostigma nucleopolyhedrovirus TaxID=490711 RepID=B0FDM5_9ABAC|nr:immediate early 1 [Orgyia leucostigma nucleopolyhedrovirus]ABY65733.1 immediate early 1 [Orgyia leucostigma nucleopolyhedrovirus]